MKPPKSPDTAAPSTLAWWKCPGVVYFVAASDPPIAIKIGMAAVTGSRDLGATLTRRLSQVQSSNHERIRLMGVIEFKDGDYPTREAEARERKLHSEFSKHCRFKAETRGAEWFDAVPELLEHIEGG